MSMFNDDDMSKPCKSVTWIQSGVGEDDVGKFKPHYCNGNEGHLLPHGCRDCGVEWRTPFIPPKRPDWGPKEVRAMMKDLIGR